MNTITSVEAQQIWKTEEKTIQNNKAMRLRHWLRELGIKRGNKQASVRSVRQPERGYKPIMVTTDIITPEQEKALKEKCTGLSVYTSTNFSYIIY